MRSLYSELSIRAHVVSALYGLNGHRAITLVPKLGRRSPCAPRSGFRPNGTGPTARLCRPAP